MCNVFVGQVKPDIIDWVQIGSVKLTVTVKFSSGVDTADNDPRVTGMSKAVVFGL